MTDDTVGRLDAFDGRVAGGAIVSQMLVSRGQRAGLGHPLPGNRLLEGGLTRCQHPQQNQNQRTCDRQNSRENPFRLCGAGCHHRIVLSAFVVGEGGVIQAPVMLKKLQFDIAAVGVDPDAYFRRHIPLYKVQQAVIATIAKQSPVGFQNP